ncbi:MAG: TraR/DksA family transcriptional regulator [Chloroflexi bacterium]|nr:MAG: TraR/DksA family transcriptional regulator [Chloroflexota bacterium]
MSRGFRNSDATQELSEQATSDTINEILDADREQATHAADVRAHGGYGICEGCGGSIGEERLEAIPNATRCVRCQADWEQANRF